LTKQKSVGNFNRPFNSTQRVSYCSINRNPSSSLYVRRPILIKKDRVGGPTGQEEFEIEKIRNAQKKARTNFQSIENSINGQTISALASSNPMTPTQKT